MPRPAPTCAPHRAFLARSARCLAALPAAALVAVLTLATAACQTDASLPRPAVDSTDTRAKALPRLLREEERLAQFARAVEASGFAEELGGVGPYTVFAPTDEALTRSGLRLDTLLAAEDGDSLRKVVAYHLARGLWTVERMGDSLRVATLLDVSVRLERTPDGRALRVDRRPVLASIPAQNGVLHLLGGVLSLPQPDTADVAPDSLAAAGAANDTDL